MTGLDWFLGEGSYTSQLDLLPKKTVIENLLADYLQSMLICIPAGIVFLLELMLFRKETASRLFSGILTTAALCALTYWFFNANPNPVLVVFLASLGAIILARSLTFLLTYWSGRSSGQSSGRSSRRPKKSHNDTTQNPITTQTQSVIHSEPAVKLQ